MLIDQSRSKSKTNLFEIRKCETMLGFCLFEVTFFGLGLVGGADGRVTYGLGKAKSSVACKEPNNKKALLSESMNN